jgi:hypothetical protein
MTGPAPDPPAQPVVTGVVLAVEGDGPASVTAFTLRTAEGELFEFDIERLDVSDGGKPAPHLREHQLDGAPISVEYRVEGDRNVALRYRDAE